MKRQVMIDQELFADLVKLVCFNCEELRPSVAARLEAKVSRLAAHQNFSQNVIDNRKETGS